MAGEALRLEGWALTLGASSDFGAATARHLARRGMNIVGVHLDRRNTQTLANAVRDDIARAVAAMALSETSWISGNVIGVDAGENLTS